MVGQLRLEKGWRIPLRQESLYGMPVLCARVDAQGRWGEKRLERAGRRLRGAGSLRVLVPGDFSRWDVLERQGLMAVEPARFLHAQMLPIALRALERADLTPERAAVALCARRADGEMARAALALSRCVRHLVIDAPVGGEGLAAWLRREYGVAVLPPREQVQLAVYLQRQENMREERVELFGLHPRMQGVRICAPALEQAHREDLGVVSTLWEGGFLSESALKIT